MLFHNAYVPVVHGGLTGHSNQSDDIRCCLWLPVGKDLCAQELMQFMFVTDWHGCA